MMRLVTLLFVVIVSAILGSFILGENPGKYSLGFLLVLFLGYAFISHLLYFMVGLFFLRPAIDIFLLSVRFAPGGVDLGLGGVIGLALVVGALLRALIFQKDAFKLGNGAVGLYFIFCVLSLIPFFFADDKIGSAKVMLRYFSCLAILVLTLLSIHNEKDARLLMRGMLFSVIIPIIYGFYNYFIQKGRFMGTFTHPNILAFFLLIMIGCIFFQVDQPGGFVRKFSARRILALIVLLIILVLTETRSGWVAFFIMSMMYCFFFYRKLILPALLIFVVLGMTPFVQKKITNVFISDKGRFSVNEESSLGWRFTAWRTIWNAAIEDPIIGHGINTAPKFVKEGLGAHNDYLRYFVEQGIIGVVTYLAPFIFVLMHALRHLRRFDHDPILWKLAGFFSCFIPAFFVMSISENLASYIPIQWYFWGLVGIYFAVFAIERRNRALIFS